MKIDDASETWKFIAKHIGQKEANHSARLRLQGVSERESDFLRGYLAALEELNALTQEQHPEPKKTANPYK